MFGSRKAGRRAAIALSLVATATLLVGCGTNSDSGGGDADAPISLLSSGDADTSQGQGKALFDVLSAFTEDTGIEATLDRVAFDQYLSSATTKARAKKLNDVVELLPGANFAALFPSLVDITKDDVEDADLLAGWPAAVKDTANPDVYAGVPVGAQGTLWYYNKALFEQAGLDPEKAPETWEELIADAKALKAAGIDPIGMSGVDSFLLWWAWSSMSPQFFSAEDVNAVRAGEIPLTDSRFADSLEPLLETYTEGLWNVDYKSKKFSDVEADFAAGKVAIVPGLISNAMNWAVWDEKLGKDAYGVFTAPAVDGAPHQGQFFNPVLVYGVSVDSKNPEGAKKLIAAMASKEGQTILLQEAGQFPNRTDVDVEGITGSAGAGAILDIVDAVGGVDVVQNQFTGAAQQASWTNLTVTFESGSIDAFLEDLEKQQRS